MGDDVSICEIAVSTDGTFHRCEEREVDIHAPVCTAVERTGRRGRSAASGLDGIGEQYQPGGLVSPAVLLEDLGPDVFRACEDLLREGRKLFLLGAGSPVGIDLHCAGSSHLLDVPDHVSGVSAHKEGDESDDYDTAKTNTAGFGYGAAASAVIDVGAFSSAVEFHGWIGLEQETNTGVENVPLLDEIV